MASDVLSIVHHQGEKYADTRQRWRRTDAKQTVNVPERHQVRQTLSNTHIQCSIRTRDAVSDEMTSAGGRHELCSASWSITTVKNQCVQATNVRENNLDGRDNDTCWNIARGHSGRLTANKLALWRSRGNDIIGT